MRHISIGLFLFIIQVVSYGQTNVDTLFNKLNNRQIITIIHPFTNVRMHSLQADTIIQIGKSNTSKLISLLTDSSKGIIVHFILSRIWQEKLSHLGNVSELNTGSDSVSNPIPTHKLNGLAFSVDKNGYVFSTQQELERLKLFWINFAKN